MDQHPLTAVLAALFSAVTGRPVEAERWADTVDRWQNSHPAGPSELDAEAWAALVRAMLCRNGIKQMRADADEATIRFAAQHIVAPAPALYQGIARVLSGDLDGGDACLEEAATVAEEVSAPETGAIALAQRSLLAMARGEGDRAQALADQAGAALDLAGVDEPLVCAVHARIALHRGDIPAVRHELVRAQRLRPLLSHALPYFAVQARIELTRVHLALGDLAGARTLMREADEVLRRRPGLGILVEEANALRDQLANERGPAAAGASALTAAELRLLPRLATHLSFPEIGDALYLSRHTIKSQANSIYRKLGAATRSQAVTQARNLGLLEG
jgi:LuxR family transcriptional regulator, maltose regulon positive regulatory protein